MRILVGTDDGLLELGIDGAPGTQQHAGRRVIALGAEFPDVWAIVDGDEVWHSAGPDSWDHRSSLEGLRANCIAVTRAGVLVGTSDARLFRMTEEGLDRVVSFDETEGRHDWYTPWGGPPDSRSITEDDDAVYVNVHVGGIVRTTDDGTSWQPTIDIDADVHRVLALESVVAACAWGLAVSEDRGATWTFRSDGLHATYCRGVAICGDALVVSASDGPRGGRAGLYRGSLAGGRLERCREGLPEWFDDNIDSSCLDGIPDLGAVAFGTTDGRVFASTDEGGIWTEVASGLPPVRCALLMP